MFCRITVVSSLLLFAVLGLSFSQEVWVAKDGSVRSIDTRALAVAGGDLYLATRNELYRSSDKKQKLEPMFSIASTDNEIRCIAARGDELFVGTRQGVYASSGRSGQWRRVFRAIVQEKNDILAIVATGGSSVVVGTGKGVYRTTDGGARWTDISGILKSRRIGCVTCGSAGMYAGTDDGVYFNKGAGAEWSRVYIKSAADEKDETGEPTAVEAEESIESYSATLAVKGIRLFVGTGNKLAYTDDNGTAWHALPSAGLGGTIRCILPSRSSGVVYCGTSKGVFEYVPDKQRWAELWRGAGRSLDVRCIVFDREGEGVLLAATEKGFYRYECGKFAPDESVDIEKARTTVRVIFDQEPPFEELQRAAMKFAEVDPEKIREWRAQARLKPLIPKITVGADTSSSNTYEIYTSATRDYVTTGPEDISNGIDVSVSWDLGNMIWSDDQTNIDVRSRLTTQLRNDILDDLRRAYFERKRLQFESIMYPSNDVRVRFEKELRIQELTQTINDLTGNYLAKYSRSTMLNTKK